MVVEPVKIQGVWRNPKTPNTAYAGRLGLGAFLSFFPELQQFPVFEPFSPQPPVTQTVRHANQGAIMDVPNLNKVRRLLILLGLVLSACAPASSAIQTAIAETQSAVTSTPPLPTPSPTQWAWSVIRSFFNQEQHNDSDLWRENVLALDLEIPGAFEMKLDMESVGSNFIILANVRDNLQMVCEGGTLGVFITDAASKMVFDNNTRRPTMPIVDGTTICQITAKFDQYGRHIEMYQNNLLIFQLTPEEVGDFPGGLFPDGKLLKVYLTTGPRSGSSVSGFTITRVKLNELVFYAQSPVMSGSTDTNSPEPTP